jgi:hypothetical protein
MFRKRGKYEELFQIGSNVFPIINTFIPAVRWYCKSIPNYLNDITGNESTIYLGILMRYSSDLLSFIRHHFLKPVKALRVCLFLLMTRLGPVDFFHSSGGGLTAVHPPSTTIVWPVICLARSDTRKRAASAISRVWAGLPMGVMVDQVFR